MSSNIGKYDVVYTPEASEYRHTWHKLETPVSGIIKMDGSNVPLAFPEIVESRFQLSDIGNEQLIQLPMDADDVEQANPLNGWKMLLAKNQAGLIPLHVAKNGYQIHQNIDLFKSLISAANKVLGADKITIVTIGTLGNNSQFFVSIAINGMGDFNIETKRGKQLHKLFLNLVSSHDGMTASAIMLSIIRMVCQNTVNASLSDAESNGRASKFKHTANSLELITPISFEKSLIAWQASAESYRNALQAFESQTMTLDGFRSFASGVFTNEGSDCLSSNSFNRVTEMESLFAKGRGNYGETLSDGINAFTEYFTSGNGTGSNKVSPGKRVASANFGRGNDWKKLAIAIASNENDFTATCKRGEILYSDKLKAISTAN